MKTAKLLFSPVFMAVLLILLAFFMALATFIENDYGSQAARGMIYNAHWFELLFFLLAVNLSGQVVIYKLYRREKLTVLLFHLAFIVMIAGAAVTRYTGFEGTMHIREGETSSVVNTSKAVTLPFALKLNDFIIERYPGSDSPSGFKSSVVVIDKKGGAGDPFVIYMNHILKYRGYRFFQSSYDEDEKGTLLSVNHDPAGMIITYTGYALLFLFIMLSIFNRKSFFRTVTSGNWNSKLRRTAVIFLLLAGASFTSVARSQQLIPDKKEADKFGTVLAQDQKGRTKPLNTISYDIIRKVTGESRFNGLSAMQVFAGYSFDFEHWMNVPLIKVSDSQLKKILGLKTDYASFSDVVTLGEGGSYKLESYANRAYSKPAAQRTRFDKAVIKLDERLNICYMMGQGDFLCVFPLRDSTDHWGTAAEAISKNLSYEDSVFVHDVMPLWIASATGKPRGGKEITTDEYIAALRNYQEENSTYTLPTDFKVRAEVFYNKAGIFEKLFPFYFSIGLILVITLIGGIIAGRTRGSVFIDILVVLTATAFLFHTFGLGLRWYISGHSPMSNGYETMIFISWVILLAGFIFGRKSLLTLAATIVLAGMTLMVGHLSFMDPEITNLVPVLKSYWLTLHVSVITGSYGFLALGAILGLIVLTMMLFVNSKNQVRIADTIDQLTVINYKTLTLGLYFLTIGTFLGAIWANESWGRYWGWDPKETWSLITIVIYTLVLHSRLIPGMKNIYAFNLLSLVAFSSVLMTFFGVNYYLSGMHSYAAGDTPPVPAFVYFAVVVVVGLAVVSFLKYKRQK